MSSLNPCNHRFTKENHKGRKICQWNDMLTCLRNNKIFLKLNISVSDMAKQSCQSIKACLGNVIGPEISNVG